MDSTLWGIPYSDWRIYNSFAPWLSAVGTLIAVGVALFIFRKEKSLKLGFDVMMYTDSIIEESGKKWETGIMLLVTNYGLRSVMIDGITLICEGTHCGAEYKTYKVYKGYENLPVLISEQESLKVMFTLDTIGYWKKTNSDSLGFGVRTSINKNFKVKIPRDLADRIKAKEKN